ERRGRGGGPDPWRGGGRGGGGCRALGGLPGRAGGFHLFCIELGHDAVVFGQRLLHPACGHELVVHLRHDAAILGVREALGERLVRDLDGGEDGIEAELDVEGRRGAFRQR